VAATGYDALTHALEALWNRNANPVSDTLALYAATGVLKAIEPAWREASTKATTTAGGSGAARAVLLRAATSAGVAFNRTGTAAIHALSFIVSEEWHLSHGSACALFTEEIFDTNLADPAVRTKLVLLARQALNLDNQTQRDDTAALSALRDRLVALKQLMGLPCRFTDIPGFSPPGDAATLDALCARFDPSQNDPKLKNNVVALDLASVRELVRGKLR
jgi:alcohol dehydrogenase class IV